MTRNWWRQMGSAMPRNDPPLFNPALTRPLRVLANWRLWVFVIPLLVVLSIASPCQHFLLTGHFFPVDMIEKLESPIDVKGWTEEGLLLPNGGIIPLKGLAGLPEDSEALRLGIAQGVEVDQEGNVHGLVRIHHWCGNDPVRNHMTRINLAHLLMFLGEGHTQAPVPAGLAPAPDGFNYSDHGWNISDFSSFRRFVDCLEREANTAGSH